MTKSKKIILKSLKLAKMERLLVEKAVNHTYSILGASKLLGVSRNKVRTLITKYNIDWWPAWRDKESW